VTEKLTVELTESEIDVIVGGLGALLAENESWIHNYDPVSNNDTEGYQDVFFKQLSENLIATDLLTKLASLIGWGDTQVKEYLEIIQREIKSK
jgi:hypothetical protein